MSINSKMVEFILSSIAVLGSISPITPALARDECELPTLPGIDTSQVKVVKHISTRDRMLEKFIDPKQYPVSENSFFTYSYNKVDLDGDGKPEILLRVTSPLCGSGGCQISILKFDGRKYITIDDSLSFGQYIITSRKTNGFKDIIIPYAKGYDNMYILLQYQGNQRRYQQKLKKYTSNLKIKGTAYLTCGTYHNLPK